MADEQTDVQRTLIERTLEDAKTSDLPPGIQAQIEQQLRSMAQELPTEAHAQEDSKAPEESTTTETPVEPQSEFESIKARLAQLEEENRVWQARYSTLRGKYDAEIAAVRANSEPPKAPQQTEDYEFIQTKLKKELSDKFEDDAIELATAAAKAALAEVQRELTPIKDTLSSQRQLALQATLDTRIPDWRSIASDPSYQTWLGEADPISGLSRQAIMATALQTGDVERIEAVLGAYRATRQPAPQERRAQGQTVSTTAVPKPRNPQATTTSYAPEPPSAADWRDLANRVARREITPAAAEEMFAKMLAAMRQG